MTVRLTDQFKLEGDELELRQAEEIKTQGVAMIEHMPGPFHVDLAGLARANSVTVAVLVSWYRHAVLQEKSIFFKNFSAELHNIIEFSGLGGLLFREES